MVPDGEDPLFSGDVCIDGSRLGTTLAPQAGWAAAQITAPGAQEVVAEKAAWGPTPLRLPVDARSIKRSEMYALVFVLLHAFLPVTIWTDHKAIVDGLARGRAWCTAARRHHADIWCQVWRLLDELGIAEGTADLRNLVRHVKAHRSLRAIQLLGDEEQRVAMGNRLVDAMAKRGAEEAPGFGRDLAVRKLSEQVKWAIRSIAWWHNHADFADGWPDVTPWRQWSGQLASAPLQEPRWQQHGQPHLLHEEGSTLVSRRCARWARSRAGRGRLQRGRCRPRPPEEAAQRGAVVVWNEHILMLAGDNLIWCLRCGRWAHRYTSHLRSQVCRGGLTPSTATRYRSLCEGRHPLPPHDFVGEVRPLQLAVWPRWCRRAEAARAVEMPAARVAPLLDDERALEVIEVDTDDDLEPLAETLVLD